MSQTDMDGMMYKIEGEDLYLIGTSEHSMIGRFIDQILPAESLSIFGLHSALYAMIAIYMLTKISDGIVEGVKFAKAIYIISDHTDQIAQNIMEELGRGVTGLDVTGMYSGEKRKMLYCVVSTSEIVRIKELVARTDKNAFVIVSDAREVLGEGFIEY